MDDLIEGLQRLPKAKITCQGDIVPWPKLVRDDDGPPFRPQVPLWADSSSGQIHTIGLLGPNDDVLRGSLEALVGFVEKLLQSRACPQRIEVRNRELADYLEHHLSGTGIEVRLTDQLPKLDAAVREMKQVVSQQSQAPPLPSLLDSRGVTIERVRAFAEAAAEFYRAAPWRYLSDVDMIHVESPKPPRGMSHLVVLGAGRSMYGLGIYPSRKAFNDFLRAGLAGDHAAAIAARLAQVIFDSVEEIPEPDAELWSQHQLPVANEQAYPMVLKLGAEKQPARPTAKELAYLEGVLRTLAATTEEEIDSGRWQKQVATHEGQRDVVLAIPDLLEPPSPEEWMRRGFMPDPRANERVSADIHRFLAAHPLTDEDGFAAINKLFAGRSLDNPVTKPSTPAEQSQDLCFQAFDSHGRRRVQLAREALRVDPDCCDAHVILAEQSATLEDTVRQYQLGMEAAQRKLGAEYFSENAGHFWGLAETRPYMRSRLALAQLLAETGQIDDAASHYQALLRLNPGDNQGVRYLLLPLLLTAGRDIEAAQFLKAHNEDSANWAFARALLAFRLSGPSPSAERELRSAAQLNTHVPNLLVSTEPIPQPPYYAEGSFEEACVVVSELRLAYAATPGALEWVASTCSRRDKHLDKQRREERTKQKKHKRR